MSQIICIVGTDTGIGKTYASCQIMAYLQSQHKSVVGLKPLASGKTLTAKGWMNEDVELLQRGGSIFLEQSLINPFSFTEAIAPHLAARKQNTHLNVENVHAAITSSLNALDTEYILIEGVGGIMVPLNNHETYLDLLKTLGYPVILVVGMRLGCLNHALLSCHALKQQEINCQGWLANFLDPQMSHAPENLAYLRHKLAIPFMGSITYHGNFKPNNEFKEVWI